MNEREHKICSRIRSFRESIRLSQAEFANELGISRDQIAGIEYGRTPLRYLTAWNYRRIFGGSITSLVEDRFPVAAEDIDAWPAPELLENDSILLSEVWDKMLEIGSPVYVNSGELGFDKPPPKSIPPDHLHRVAHIELMAQTLKDAIAKVPEGLVIDFHSKIQVAIEKALAEYPPEPESRVQKRLEKIGWAIIRKDVLRRLPPKSARNSLTNKSTSSNIAELKVKPQWPALKERIKEATAKAGYKSKLADFLKVDLTRISQWLSDSKNAREPGAEYALQMLYWVEHPELQK